MCSNWFLVEIQFIHINRNNLQWMVWFYCHTSSLDNLIKAFVQNLSIHYTVNICHINTNIYHNCKTIFNLSIFDKILAWHFPTSQPIESSDCFLFNLIIEMHPLNNIFCCPMKIQQFFFSHTNTSQWRNCVLFKFRFIIQYFGIPFMHKCGFQVYQSSEFAILAVEL